MALELVRNLENPSSQAPILSSQPLLHFKSNNECLFRTQNTYNPNSKLKSCVHNVL